MQSSYSVIKSNNLYSGDSIKVNTDYENKKLLKKVMESKEAFKNNSENIIVQAEVEKEEIITLAYEKASRIEKEAYEKAYKEGFNNGLEDGYKEAYENNIERALEEANTIREEAVTILHSAKKEYEEYLMKKETSILDLAYNIAAHILDESLSKDYGLNKFIENVLRDSRGCKSFVIRVNKIHKDFILGEIEKWKVEFSLRGEIFVLEDDSVLKGNAVIEMESGKVQVGLEKALESIRVEIF